MQRIKQRLRYFLTHFILFCLLFTIEISGIAQPSITLKCNGKIPTNLMGTAKNKYLQDKTKLKRGKNRKVLDDFYLLNNYSLNSIIKSGRILFGDELTMYVNKVAKEVLKSDPELLSKLKIYVFKSSEVNAFSTQQGYIFINVGLIAQLENEAQLACIIAHEAIHFKKQHSINQFIESNELIKGKGNYENMNFEEREKFYYSRSKENEIEADYLGLKDIFLKSKYSIAEAANLYDILLYSNLPFDEIEFDSTFFDTPYFKLSSDKILTETSAITSIENFEDKNESHPNIKKRRELFLEITKDYSDKDREAFIVSKEKFYEIRNKARKEIIGYYILNNDYSKALYCSYLLQMHDRNNDFINYAINYILYATSKSKTISDLEIGWNKYKKVEGKSQRVNYFFAKIEKEELCLLAINKIWQTTKNSSFSLYNYKLLEDLINDAIQKYHYSGNEFIVFSKYALDTSFIKLSNVAYSELSKKEQFIYDSKSKVYKKNEIIQYKTSPLLFKLMEDSLFEKFFKRVESKALKTYFNDSNEINIKSDLINNPNIWIVITDYKKLIYNQIDLEKSELKKIELYNLINQCAIHNEMNTKVLDPTIFESNQVEDYNNLFLTTSWIHEIGLQIILNYYNFEKNTFGIIPFLQPAIDSLSTTNKFENLMITFVSSSLETRNNKAAVLAITTVIWPLFPFGIYYLVTPVNQTKILSWIVNTKTGKISLSHKENIKYSDFNGVLKSQYYEYFYNLKNDND